MNNLRSNLFALAVASLFLGGCATSPMSISKQDTSSLYGSKLTVIQYEPDPFLPMTNTKGAFALLGVAAAVSEGSTLVKEHQLVDPAGGIKTSLAKGLSETYDITDITITDEIIPYESNPEDVAAMASNEGFVLDVRTFGWGTMYYPFTTKYKVDYFAQARLINTKDKRIISAERCLINEPMSDDSPTYDELMENNATLLKTKLEDASSECAEKFALNMGVIQTTPNN